MKQKRLWNIIILIVITSFTAEAHMANANLNICRPKPIEIVQATLGLDDPNSPFSIYAIQSMLSKQSPSMRPTVIQKVMNALKCAEQKGMEHKPVLTVIDFSLPSSQKRLWIFDLKQHQLLFHTFVSHGIKSGHLLSNYFSNRHNSKASSIGVYKTDRAYYGRHGLSLKLEGLERRFNDNAFNRAIVMHGSWYVEEAFVEKYGRAGRSWGCPAVPKTLTKPIINTIKDNAIFVAYYPNEDWFLHSDYLNCSNHSNVPLVAELETNDEQPVENRADILFAEKNNNNTREEYEPIVVISADDYKHHFKNKIPLKRMLRRQINDQEYIALNTDEFKKLTELSRETVLNQVFFVIPEVKNLRGYYATEMKIMPYGDIKAVDAHPDSSPSNFTVRFEKSPELHLKTTDQFIRWLGL